MLKNNGAMHHLPQLSQNMLGLPEILFGTHGHIPEKSVKRSPEPVLKTWEWWDWSDTAFSPRFNKISPAEPEMYCAMNKKINKVMEGRQSTVALQ